jgi:hypothetical protein
MSLLTIVRDAAVEVGVPQPDTVIGNPDGTAAKLLRMAQRVGRDIVARADFSALRVASTFAAVAGEAQAGVIPTDFARLVPESLWDRTNDRLLAGPINGARYQALVATMPGDGFARWFTLRGTTLAIYPAMSGGETCAFEYISRNFCETAEGVGRASWQADTDVGRVSEELITLGVVAFFLKSHSFDNWPAAMADYEARLTTDLMSDQANGGVLSAGDIFGNRRALASTPPADGITAWGW